MNGCTPDTTSKICDLLSATDGVDRTEIVIPNSSSETQHSTAIVVYFFAEQTGARDLYHVISQSCPSLEIAVKSINEFSKKDLDTDPLEVLRARFYASLIFFFPMVLSVYVFPNISYFREWTTFVLFRGLPLKFFLEWLLATPVQLWLAQPIYKSAWEAAKYTKKPNMDTLISLSTSVAYFYSFGVICAIIAVGSDGGNLILEEVFFETR